MTLAFPDPDKRICVLTNASDRYYAGLVTQIHEEQLDLPMEEQDHQPLAFLSGEFNGAQLRWTVPEKEGFAVVDTVTKVDYLLLSHDEFSILSDHLNLTYIYNPLPADPTLARHVVHKLQRWALKMSVFSYRMEHVMGELNNQLCDAAATGDALMRWFAVFGVMLLWISDRGRHFKNEVVRRVQKELKAKHHFTTANCPWSNGTIEFACKQVIRAFRAVLSELKMYADESPEVVNLVQSVLNSSLSTSLNNRTPMESSLDTRRLRRSR
jgi:RNase H-like domain found in reverse transcriptase